MSTQLATWAYIGTPLALAGLAWIAVLLADRWMSGHGKDR